MNIRCHRGCTLFNVFLFGISEEPWQYESVSKDPCIFYVLFAPCKVHLQEDKTSCSKHVKEIINRNIILEKMYFVGLYCIITGPSGRAV